MSLRPHKAFSKSPQVPPEIMGRGNNVSPLKGEKEKISDSEILLKNTCTTSVGVNAEVAEPSTALSGREIISWLREEGLRMSVITKMVVVERISIYDWLSGEPIPPHKQERLERIYSLLNENKIASLRNLYRYWFREVISERSLATMFQEEVLDEKTIREALSQLWPLAKKAEDREIPIEITPALFKSHPFLRESREVTLSHDY